MLFDFTVTWLTDTSDQIALDYGEYLRCSTLMLMLVKGGDFKNQLTSLTLTPSLPKHSHP